MAKKKSTKPQKGVAGKGTGGKTRKAIRDARKRGFTNEQIGVAGMRSPGVISSILSTDKDSIKNPPANLAGKIRKGLVGKKPKKKKK